LIAITKTADDENSVVLCERQWWKFGYFYQWNENYNEYTTALWQWSL